jgi:hypothetical protein
VVALYEEAVDPNLAELVRTAVHACNALVIELEAANKYIGGHSMGFPLSVETPTHGWPKVSTAFISEAPTDYGGAFGLKAGRFSAYAYDDVPELKAAIDYMTSDARLASRLNDGIDTAVDHFTRIGGALFVTNILDRLRHTIGAEISDGDINDLYLEVEPTMVLDRLPIDIVIPVVLTSFDVEDQVELAPGLRIERMSDGLNRARNLGTLGHHDVHPLVANAATHAIVLVGWTMPWPDAWYHAENRWPIDVIDRAFRAMELASPGVMPGYAQILIRPCGWARRWRADLPPILRGPTLVRYPPSFTKLGWNTPGTHFGSDDLKAAGSIFQGLDSCAKPLSIAIRRQGNALLREKVDDRIIDLCIGLEALCGDRGEVTYKLRMRVAALLTITARTEGLTTKDLINGVKRIYDLRSRLVHGDDPGKYGTVTFEDGSTIDTVDLLSKLIRSCILAILDRPDLASMGALDEAMIDATLPPAD